MQEEILARQPGDLRRFLLDTAVLTRLSAPVCQAVTGAPDRRACQRQLEALERANLFVVPLDEERRWYRLHDLFREALLARLAAQEPALLPRLHLRAAGWYEAVGELPEAIAHALAAPDFPYAARLMERAAPALLVSGEAQTVQAWLAALPETVLWRHAPLALGALLHRLHAAYATTEGFYTGAHAQVEHALARLDGLLHRQVPATPPDQPGGAATPLAELPVIARRLRLLRAFMEGETCLRQGDRARLAQLAGEVDGLVADEREPTWRVIALAIHFGLTEVFQREGALLLPRLLEARQGAEWAGTPLASARVAVWLTYAYLRAGRWPQVERECLAALALLARHGARLAFAGYLQSFLAEVYYAWNQLDRAADAAQETLRIGREWQQVDVLTAGHLYLLWIGLARGDLAAAEQALGRAEAFVQRERWLQRFYPVAAFRVQYWLAAGELGAASRWAEQAAFSPARWGPNDKWALLILVRVRLAQHRYAEALELLERFRPQFDRPGDVYHAIRHRALTVVALHQAGQRERAQRALARLLALTEPAGDLRVFLDLGAPMRQALGAFRAPTSRRRAPAASSSTAAYVARLLAAFEREGPGASRSPAGPSTRTPGASPGAAAPGASLTRRELEVLRLLADGASNQEIARTLIIELSTAKKHVSNLLAKLDATSRTQAVARARLRSLL